MNEEESFIGKSLWLFPGIQLNEIFRVCCISMVGVGSIGFGV